AGDNKTGQALSAIGANIPITITDPSHQTQDIGTIRRDTENTNTSLPGLPDLQNILRDQYKTQADLQAAQKTAATLVADIAQGLEDRAATDAEREFWKNGGTGRALLHAIAGGLLGGVNGWEGALKGAAGGATATLFAPAIKQLVDGILNGTTLDEDQKKQLATLMGANLAAAVGGAVGGGEGAAYGQAEYQYNYLKTEEYKERIALAAKGCDDGTPNCTRLKELETLSKDRDAQLNQCVGDISSSCVKAREDLRITAAEYIDAWVTSTEGTDDSLYFLSRNLVLQDLLTYLDNSDAKDNAALSSAASNLKSNAAKNLLTAGSEADLRGAIGAILFVSFTNADTKITSMGDEGTSGNKDPGVQKMSIQEIN
ncbi:DUF6862 domain-containing protein, partial [Rhizobium rhizogenes]|uniref:DUF6862 domain-containing protein n=1 Tax=Rhizobium rhizogenes TaxID=359 RepID=UPI0035AC2346